MSFRKRNVAISNKAEASAKPTSATPKPQLPGVKPSSIDGRPVTSTGTATLDGLLAGHGGLALGCSLLIEESGSTDYAGALLKFYAAEGILQGHHIHVLGLPEAWGRELPGAVGDSDKSSKTSSRSSANGEKMKIAWRYESLGQFGATPAGPRETPTTPSATTNVDAQKAGPTGPSTTQYSHTFDLSKRLAHPPSTSLTFHSFSPPNSGSPFASLLTDLTTSLSTHSQTPHRLILPSLFTPLLYPPQTQHPHVILPFLRQLRSLLAAHPLTIITTLPLTLSPRTAGLTRWIEILHDGVIELTPFPHSADTLFTNTSSKSSSTHPAGEEPPQGLLKIHKLPLLTDRASGVRNAEAGGDGGGGADDWAFSLTRRRLIVRAWRLGPVEDDADGEGAGAPADETSQDQKKAGGKAKKEGMEF
jgi:elongator complex protein 4